MKSINLQEHHYHALEYVSKQMLDAIKRPDDILRCAAGNLIDRMNRYTIEKCLKTKMIPDTDQVVLSVDFYVFSQDDLDQLIIEARERGRIDAMRYDRREW